MRGGNSSSAIEPKDTSDGPSYKYSKEYMLSLYTPDAQPSVQMKHHEYAVVSESQGPLSSLSKDLFDNSTGKERKAN